VTANDNAPVSIETHIFGFDGDLYGTRVNLEFFLRLRDERRFRGIDALIAQIHRDIRRARHYFEWVRRIAPALVAEQVRLAELCPGGGPWL
jgi:FAD synthase